MIRDADYARFLKADLQMQTPVDARNWRGADRIRPGSEDDLRACADKYADRIISVGLELIAITDHNLGGPFAGDFRKQLRYRFKKHRDNHGWAPVVFPGFELAANVGKGLHLLCIFDPSVDHATVDAVLSELGMTPGARFKDGQPQPTMKNLDEVLLVVQAKHGGLVIAAHPDANNGALSDRDLDTWLQKSVILNPKLLCMELREGRRPHEGRQGRIGMVVRNDGDWRRPHPIAVVSSSDCKRLDEEDGGGTDSWIGKRHCWLKMSDTTIEGLRQAFIDHESRIRFGPDRPEEAMTHPHIERIVVTRSAFLGDLDVELPKSYTAIIGGGGTGKSTLLEHIRSLLGLTALDGPTDNPEKARRSLGSGVISAVLVQGSDRLHVSWSSERGLTLDEMAVDDKTIAARFPARVLSQREVYAVATSSKATSELVDDLARDRLSELEREAAGHVAELERIDAEVSHRRAIGARRQQAEAERDRAQATLNALVGADATAQRVAEIQSRLTEWHALVDHAGEVEAELSRIKLPDAPQRHDVDRDSFAEQRKALASARTLTIAKLREVRADYKGSVQAILMSSVSADLDTELAAANVEHEQATQTTTGANPGTLQATIEARRAEILELDGALRQIGELEAERPGWVLRLQQVWAKQVTVRRETAERLERRVPTTAAGTPYVSIEVLPFSDHRTVVELVLRHIPDRRQFNEADASMVAAAAFADSQDGDTTALAVLKRWADGLRHGSVPLPLSTLTQGRAEALINALAGPLYAELDRVRIPDRLSVVLRRRDGTDAGRLDGDLSVGQRCTAILAILLADGNHPVVIDQPEDEIANEFIYEELVPLIRSAKERRQVIVSTHDPNLPVNGDAELIIALETRATEVGYRAMVVEAKRLSTNCEGLAIGALDRPAVKLAVEEIMEGSETAFRRRQVKYGL